MRILLLKLTITPSLIYLASLASRRWGHAIGGWIVALPLTAGPVVFFPAVENGHAFAASSAVGCLAGGLAEAGFCLSYSWSALQFRWPVSLFAGALAFGVTAAFLRQFHLRLTFLSPIAVFILFLTLILMPRGSAHTGAGLGRAWELPLRMAFATGVVVLLTASAKVIGPTLSGVFATFPVYAAILATFAHRLDGWNAAVQVLRGLLFGLFSFAAFFTVLALLIEHSALGVSFLVAIIACLVVQVCSLWALGRAS